MIARYRRIYVITANNLLHFSRFFYTHKKAKICGYQKEYPQKIKKFVDMRIKTAE